MQDTSNAFDTAATQHNRWIISMALKSTKPALASLTIISAGIAVLAQGVKLAFGYTIAPADQAILMSYGQSAVEIGTTLVTLAGGIGAIWGRMRATKAITTKRIIPEVK